MSNNNITEMTDNIPRSAGDVERQVVILMTDMIRYSQLTAPMRPDQVRDFIIDYHTKIQGIVTQPEFEPVDIEPLAGDGALIIFEKREGESLSGVCDRAVEAAVQLAHGVEDGVLASTRIGLHRGEIIEADLGARRVKFGAGFAIANRLEELCGYFGTLLLIDGNIVEHLEHKNERVVKVGKITLQSFTNAIELHTVYEPGIYGIPKDTDELLLKEFIKRKNEAMDYFSGNGKLGLLPDFPKVLELLGEVKGLFWSITGKLDKPSERILEYIRETPLPKEDFSTQGMRLSEKNRSSIGDRLFHLSRELLKAMNHEFYHALVVDTEWERFFKLLWKKRGETIITINDQPDGVYFIDSGEVVTLNEDGEQIAHLSTGTIFGEMAYFSKERKRTATVVAATDVVMRRISSKDFEKLPVIMKIFERIAKARS